MLRPLQSNQYANSNEPAKMGIIFKEACLFLLCVWRSMFMIYQYQCLSVSVYLSVSLSVCFCCTLPSRLPSSVLDSRLMDETCRFFKNVSDKCCTYKLRKLAMFLYGLTRSSPKIQLICNKMPI